MLHDRERGDPPATESGGRVSTRSGAAALLEPKLLVAGVGASAGGLDAYKKLLGAMPATSGVAFVVVPHLDPAHKSLMVQLLSKCTAMPVLEVQEGMSVQANHVYVIPPNKYLNIKAGVLHLSRPVEQPKDTSIDWFLRSLAEDQREKAIGIILSGTGSHGTPGLKAVKANGGIAFVQDPATAQFPSMPENAIATGLVDHVAPVEKIAEILTQYAQSFSSRGWQLAKGTIQPGTLEEILVLLRAGTRFDFRGYRKNMLRRRIERRMGLAHVGEMSQYLVYLRSHPDEIGLLAKDVMISVTSFFREPRGAFHILEKEVIPQLIRSKAPDGPLRAWVAGCATGEEAYSIAMLFLEGLAAAGQSYPLRIFASDLDEAALAFARAGLYPQSIAADVSPERLSRFFSQVDGHSYQVKPRVREVVTFARHDLAGDAPYSNLDLVSCRNLLIYLEPELQQKVIPLLHFALRDQGYLLLGPSESVGRHEDLFEPVAKKWRLYRRVGPGRKDLIDFAVIAKKTSRPDANRPYQRSAPGQPTKPTELMQRLLLNVYAPASVLVDGKGEILQYHGPTLLYLDLPGGEPTHNVLKMARPGLRNKLRAAMGKAGTEPPPVVVDARIERDGGHAMVHVSVRSVKASGYFEPLLLISFEDGREPAVTPAIATADESVVRQLEYELEGTREELEGTIDELQIAGEDMKSATEETMSMNEELQSANEELETSKEELQSLNEELIEVNNQLQGKLEELERSHNDVTNLINSADVPTLFLDARLCVKWFTPATTRVLSLIPTDVGRPVSDIVQKVPDPDLPRDTEQVLSNHAPIERELCGAGGQWWMRRILPYRTSHDEVMGVVITFIDITGPKLAGERMRRLSSVVMDSNDAVTVHDFSGRITAWNRSAERMYGYTETEALNLNIAHLIPEALRPAESALLEQSRLGEPVEPRETLRLSKDGTIRDVWLTTTTLRDGNGIPISIATTERDMTERKATVRIQHLATHDLLTGLPNRLLLDELVDQAFSHAGRTQSQVALLFVDIDNFKAINDSLGHQTGDLVLQAVGRRLRHCVRGHDSVVRHGGDEFIVVLTDTANAQAAGRAADHILSAISRPYKVANTEVAATVSIGIALYPDDAADLEELIRKADAAMYRAKVGGRNTYRFFMRDLSSSTPERSSWERELHGALDQNEFLLYCQPQVEIKTGRITGAESLVRWLHPDLGLLPPARFIPLAEETGLIVRLGEWVLFEACRQARTWPPAGLSPLRVAVNISPLQFGEPGFPEMVARALRETAMDPSNLELEITESVVMRNVDASIERLKQLRDMGVRLSLDDFGTGYSSLSYLRLLPVQKLKIDVSFVHMIAGGPEGEAILKAIITVAQSLHLEVVAEGVETLDQLLFLQEHGCDEIQGYYFSEPLPAEEWANLLRENRPLLRS